jgi:NAD(P)-dependent dehydrogenase (short-subunit alcohol dehydrogenase family)
MRNCLDLTGRVAVVIGATSGIGRAIAVGLAEHGADVAPSGRREEHVEAACRDIEAAGRRTLRQTSDVTDRGSIDSLRDAVRQRFGRVDILVNAAGYTFRQPTTTVGEGKCSALIDTNLTGALRSCQSFYAPLKSSGSARIITIASLSSFVGFHEAAAYGASKTALVALTRSLAVEWARDGISVNAIAPGVFRTDMNREIILGTPRGGKC